jgi:hypothetical protein
MLRFTPKSHLFFGHHLNEVGLAMAQTHLVTHNLVFHGVSEGSVEQHLYLLAFDKAHLDNSFAEASMAGYFDDDAALACM